jgi:hypothetical protein
MAVAEDFETELAALLERHSVRLTSEQIITGLERTLDEALVLAGDPEATKVRAALVEVVPELLQHSLKYYGMPTDETGGVGLIHVKARAALALAGAVSQ